MHLAAPIRALAGGALSLLLLGTLASPAAGRLQGGAGNLNLRACSAPDRLDVGTVEDDRVAVIMLERQSLELSEDLTLDNGPAADTTVPAGHRVDVYLLHTDAASTRADGVLYQARPTFTTPILGVISTTARLNATDGTLGKPGVTYGGSGAYTGQRGYEEGIDDFDLQDRSKTLVAEPRTFNAVDELRIVTEADPDPNFRWPSTPCDEDPPAAGGWVGMPPPGGTGTGGDAGAAERTSDLPGYRLLTAAGGEYAFGSRTFLGNTTPPSPIVAGAETPSGDGYWAVTAVGHVLARGDAPDLGGMAGQPLNAPIVGFAATPSGAGYWLLGRDGGVFSFGDAVFHGSTGGQRLNRPVLGIAATPSGAGYWLVAEDGGIFTFGDATFHGSTGAMPLNRPIVGMASTPDGGGYWLVAEDGGIFSFGNAVFHGSTGGTPLNQPIVGMASTPDGGGYWLAATDGGIFSFGSATFLGSTGDVRLLAPVVALVN